MRRTVLVLLALAVVAPAALVAAGVTIPTTFTNGTVASADEVNANFAAVAAAVNGLETRTTTSEVVVTSPDGTRCTRLHLKNGEKLVTQTPVDCTTFTAPGLVQEGSAWRYADGTSAASCKEYRNAEGYADQGSGAYWIDPDGAGPNARFQVACDMITDGGGWTYFAHVNSDYVAAALFSNVSGTYSTALLDGNTTYTVGGKLLPFVPHTEMMVTLDGSSVAAADTANKLVFYRYAPNATAFTTGPVPCSGLAGFAYRFDATSAWTFGGTTNSCQSTDWYSRTAGSAAYLVLFANGAAYGQYWGVGMGGNDTWYHDGWWWVR